MITKTDEISYELFSHIKDVPEYMNYCNNDSLFFDIETTGFSPKSCQLYLIGYIFFDKDKAFYKQLFAQNKDEELLILKEFNDFCSSKKKLVHFNGNGFDIPFIKNKCFRYNIKCNLDNLESIDLYKYASTLKNLLKLVNLKQKTIEDFLSISRKDALTGGQLIKIYEDYQKANSDDSLELMLLHNYEDIIGLLSLLKLFSYRQIIDCQYKVNNFKIVDYKDVNYVDCKEIYFDLTLEYPLDKRISYGFGPYYINAFDKTARIRIKLYTDELKYFYPNYKDYYYLPEEDRSIHKSIAFYVDKDFRTKAKAANCYSKKTGKFLPQEEEVINPYFRIEYNDKTTYFEVTDSFLESINDVNAYVSHVMNVLLKSK